MATDNYFRARLDTMIDMRLELEGTGRGQPGRRAANYDGFGRSREELDRWRGSRGVDDDV